MKIAEEERIVASNWRGYLQDSRESFRVFGWVWKELLGKRAKRYAKWSLVYIVIAMIIGMAVPFITGQLIDGLIGHQKMVIVWSMVGITLCVLLNRLFRLAYNFSRERAQADNIVSIDVKLTGLFLEKSLSQHMREDGELSAPNVEKGRARVIELEGIILFDGMPAIMELVISFTFLSILSPVAGLMMGGVLVMYVMFLLVMNRKILEVTTPIDAEFRRINRHRIERWDAIERVKTSGKEIEEVEILERDTRKIMETDTDFWMWYIKVATWRGIINGFVACGVVTYGILQVWNGLWTVGLLTPLIAWSFRFSDNLWMIGKIEHRLNRAMPSVKSMKEALAVPPEVKDAENAIVLPDEPVCIELDDISHCYRGKKSIAPNVLKDVSFIVEPGEKVALIGESGAGKTTIMRLLQRYADPSSGAIRINGHELCDVQIASWRRLTAYIPQQAQILDGTIRYNLLYSMPLKERAAVKDEDLWELMRKLRIDFGERLDEGLSTVVGRRGIKLSGGEAQRLMIGAATILKPRFLIVDEATSSLDSTTEKDVQRGLEEVLQVSTSALIITHRLPTVRNLCTKFIVLKSASSVKEGENQVEAIASSFEELYAKSPTFRRLADDQGVVMKGHHPSNQLHAQGHDWYHQ